METLLIVIAATFLFSVLFGDFIVNHYRGRSVIVKGFGMEYGEKQRFKRRKVKGFEAAKRRARKILEKASRNTGNTLIGEFVDLPDFYAIGLVDVETEKLQDWVIVRPPIKMKSFIRVYSEMKGDTV